MLIDISWLSVLYITVLSSQCQFSSMKTVLTRNGESALVLEIMQFIAAVLYPFIYCIHSTYAKGIVDLIFIHLYYVTLKRMMNTLCVLSEILSSTNLAHTVHKYVVNTGTLKC
jgi:hypothetical protein